MPSPVGEDHGMSEMHQRTLAGLATAVATAEVGLDGLRQVRVPLVPEIQLHLATDAIVLWARMEAEVNAKLASPFWASAWLGGQALARYVLDHREVVAGRRVLDLAAGSGLVGIAASLAGAAAVTANDIDPYAAAAIEMNARANAVKITVSCDNLLEGGRGEDADLVLAGDVFYNRSMASAVLRFLEGASAHGAQVLIGDPGRAHLPGGRLQTVATYAATDAAPLADAEVEHVYVLGLIDRTTNTERPASSPNALARPKASNRRSRAAPRDRDGWRSFDLNRSSTDPQPREVGDRGPRSRSGA
jgi:predicted nicotinamide N-methyase